MVFVVNVVKVSEELVVLYVWLKVKLVELFEEKCVFVMSYDVYNYFGCVYGF